MEVRPKQSFRVAGAGGRKQKPGPKPVNDEVMDANLSLKVAKSELEALNELAWSMRISRSELVRRFILKGLERTANE